MLVESPRPRLSGVLFVWMRCLISLREPQWNFAALMCFISVSQTWIFIIIVVVCVFVWRGDGMEWFLGNGSEWWGRDFFEVWVPVLFSGHVFELFDQLAVPKWLCYYLWDIFVYTNKYKHKYKRMNVYGYECLHMFACMYVRAYVCIYQYMYTRAHACAYTCIQICKDNQKRVYGIFFEGECFFFWGNSYGN